MGAPSELEDGEAGRRRTGKRLLHLGGEGTIGRTVLGCLFVALAPEEVVPRHEYRSLRRSSVLMKPFVWSMPPAMVGPGPWIAPPLARTRFSVLKS